MTNYSGMSYEQLVAYIRSGDPTALHQAAKDWKQAAQSADEVTGTLAPKAQLVKPSYRGTDGVAYGQNLDTLGGFAKQLNVDTQDAYEGMLNAANALQQAQQQAEPIIAKVEAATGKEKEKLKKAAAKQLAAIMENLAAAYQDTVDKKWHDPAPGPTSAPDTRTENQPWNATDPGDENTTDVPPSTPYHPAPGTDDYSYQPHYASDDFTGGGLAGTGPAGAPTAPAGPIGAAPRSAATTAGAISTTPPPLMGGLAGAGAGGTGPTPNPKPAAKQPANRSGTVGPGLMGMGHGRSDEDDEPGEHTWLTEDEIPWTKDASAPIVIGKQDGYR